MDTTPRRTPTLWHGLIVLFTFAVAVMLCPLSVQAKTTTAKDARQVVEGWLKLDSHPLGANLSRNIGQITTRHDKKKSNVLYHVVSLLPEGFVIVSGDDMVDPIIAFQGEGSFKAEPGSPLLALLSQDIGERIRAVKKYQKEKSGKKRSKHTETFGKLAKSKWDSLKAGRVPHVLRSFSADNSRKNKGALSSISDVRVPPLMSSTWGQRTVWGLNTYNFYTPNNWYSGCVATAMGQVMRYHQHPTAGVGTGSHTYKVNGSTYSGNLRGGDNSGGAYPWTSMPLSPDGSITKDQRQFIGRLMWDAGIASHMNYTSNSSAASLTDAAVALENVFMYSNVRRIDTWSNLPGDTRGRTIYPNLDAGYPVILGILGSGSGHAVVADGYGYNGSTLYTHLNMGWDGYADLWYNLPTVDSGSYTFTAVPTVLYNIFKTGSGEIISGRVLDESGNPAQNATITATASNNAVYQATSDANGIYALAKVPSNTSFTITCSKGDLNFPIREVTTGTSVNQSTNPGNVYGVNFSPTPVGVSPAGTITDMFPDFTWPEVANAAYYQLLIRNNRTGTILKEWYAAKDIVQSGACVVTDPVRNPAGDYTWWVRTWNPSGRSEWSQGIEYDVDAPGAPGAVTLSAPTGTINDFTPTFTWQAVENATHYRLLIRKGATDLYKEWHAFIDTNAGDTISIAPKELPTGDYTAWIQTWNPNGGKGPWSNALNFSVSGSYAAAPAEITSPTGAIDTSTPTFTWPHSANAVWYYLAINKGSTNYSRSWHKAEDIMNNGTCQVAAPKGLAPGSYSAWVRPWNPDGYGDWSAQHDFSVNSYTAPGKATLTGPAASISTFYPTITWSEVPGADAYRVLIRDASSSMHKEWYFTDEVCSNGACSLESPVAHDSGDHQVWVQTWNPVGKGPWSDVREYTATIPGPPNPPF